MSEFEKQELDNEERRLDRQWYSMDDGYDDTNDAAFGGMSEEYTQRKEQELEQKKKKKMSAQQRQIQKVELRNFLIFLFIWHLRHHADGVRCGPASAVDIFQIVT